MTPQFIPVLFEQMESNLDRTGELSLENYRQLTGHLFPQIGQQTKLPEYGKTLQVVGARFGYENIVIVECV